jgi:hypothetical protein
MEQLQGRRQFFLSVNKDVFWSDLSRYVVRTANAPAQLYVIVTLSQNNSNYST